MDTTIHCHELLTDRYICLRIDSAALQYRDVYRIAKLLAINSLSKWWHIFFLWWTISLSKQKYSLQCIDLHCKWSKLFSVVFNIDELILKKTLFFGIQVLDLVKRVVLGHWWTSGRGNNFIWYRTVCSDFQARAYEMGGCWDGQKVSGTIMRTEFQFDRVKSYVHRRGYRLAKMFQKWRSSRQRYKVRTKLCERPIDASQHVWARYPGVLAESLEREVCVWRCALFAPENASFGCSASSVHLWFIVLIGMCARERVYGCGSPESWLDLDSERLTAEASRDWSIIPMFTLCL